MWYKDPSANIKLKFKEDNGDTKTISYSVVKGDKKGRYVLTVKSYKAYPKDHPNSISLYVEDILFNKR